jgi:hypothetical protein
MKKIGLKIVNLIHDITQLDYQVSFCGDFENMVRLEFLHEYDEKFYEHFHLGFPDGDMVRLERDIIRELSKFLEEHKEQR